MKEKNTDKLFKERLGGFEQEPDTLVWERIQNSLNRKKKSRFIVPIWWRWGSVAAVLIAALFLFLPKPDKLPVEPAITNMPQEKNSIESGVQDNDPEMRKKEPAEEEFVVSDKLQADAPANPEKPAMSPSLLSDKQNADHAAADSYDTGIAEVAREENRVDKNRRSAGQPSSQEAGQLEGEQDAGQGAVAIAGVLDTPLEEDNTNPSLKILPGEEEAADLASEQQAAREALLGNEAAAEETEKTSEKGRRWAIGPSIAPVYFNSFGSGSPIAQNFVANSKSGTVNVSYGVNVAYAVSKKLSVRTGLHRVDYGYNTEEVAFTSSLNAGPSSLIRTISYSENSKNLVVGSMAGDGSDIIQSNTTDVIAPSAAREGRMLQEFGYLELPLELQYNLIDKKWGLNIIGGMSSLFLTDNQLSLESGGAATEVGEANNMSAVNFSTNLGLGLYYNLSPTMRLSMQPMFKYQLNTFTETAGNFQPYSLGVYSGLNFKF